MAHAEVKSCVYGASYISKFRYIVKLKQKHQIIHWARAYYRDEC